MRGPGQQAVYALLIAARIDSSRDLGSSSLVSPFPSPGCMHERAARARARCKHGHLLRLYETGAPGRSLALVPAQFWSQSNARLSPLLHASSSFGAARMDGLYPGVTQRRATYREASLARLPSACARRRPINTASIHVERMGLSERSRSRSKALKMFRAKS